MSTMLDCGLLNFVNHQINHDGPNTFSDCDRWGQGFQPFVLIMVSLWIDQYLEIKNDFRDENMLNVNG